MSPRAGYIFSILSVILMAAAGPFQKLAMNDLDPLLTCFYSCLTASAVASFSFLFLKENWVPKFHKKFVYMSLLYVVGMTTFSYAIQTENPVIVNAVSRSYLVFNFLLSFFILKEKFTFQKIVAIICIICGTVALSMFSQGSAVSWSLGAILTLIFSLIFSFHNGLLKIGTELNFRHLIAIQNGFAGCILGLLHYSNGGKFSGPPHAILLSCLAGALSSFLGFLFYQFGLRGLTFSQASSVRSLSPIIAIVVVYPFFPMAFSSVQLIGMAFIIMGCLSFNIEMKTPDSNQI
jgi:drug/metabolite transporter (DMT)-like permease